MNCCDYKCTEGKDCPVRVAKVGQRMPAAEPLPRTTWREHLRDAATAALMVVVVMLITALIYPFF
ncbi:hypothetical protein [Hydrogenophaga aquatica]|jgi:hypothetical protein